MSTTLNTSMMLWSVYLPLNYNNQQPISNQKLMWAVNEIVRKAGGGTVLPPSAGLWIDQHGQSFYDKVSLIWTVLPESQEMEQFFRYLASELAVLLEQQEIFIHCMPVTIVDALPRNSYKLAGD